MKRLLKHPVHGFIFHSYADMKLVKETIIWFTGTCEQKLRGSKWKTFLARWRKTFGILPYFVRVECLHFFKWVDSDKTYNHFVFFHSSSGQNVISRGKNNFSFHSEKKKRRKKIIVINSFIRLLSLKKTVNFIFILLENFKNKTSDL